MINVSYAELRSLRFGSNDLEYLDLDGLKVPQAVTAEPFQVEGGLERDGLGGRQRTENF